MLDQNAEKKWYVVCKETSVGGDAQTNKGPITDRTGTVYPGDIIQLPAARVAVNKWTHRKQLVELRFDALPAQEFLAFLESQPNE